MSPQSYKKRWHMGRRRWGGDGKEDVIALLKRRTQNSDVPKELNLALTHLSKFLPKELDLLPRAARSLE